VSKKRWSSPQAKESALPESVSINGVLLLIEGFQPLAPHGRDDVWHQFVQ
jgi:hypothetical protein